MNDERCEHCGRVLVPREIAFLADNGTRILCRQCSEIGKRPIFIRRETEFFGVTFADYEQHRAALAKALGREPNYIEVIDSLYRDLERRESRKNLLLALAVEYNVAGADPFPIKQQLARLELGAPSDDYVRIVGGRCPSCRAQNGRVLTVTEALATMPVPCPNCSFGVTETEPFAWCTCMYISTRPPVEARQKPVANL